MKEFPHSLVETENGKDCKVCHNLKTKDCFISKYNYMIAAFYIEMLNGIDIEWLLIKYGYNNINDLIVNISKLNPELIYQVAEERSKNPDSYPWKNPF